MNMQSIPTDLTLCDDVVSLVPLTLEHTDALYAASLDDSIWLYLPTPTPQSPADTETLIREALADRDAGTSVPFAIVDADSGSVVGSTRYLEIQPEHRGLEVGWTWITPTHQRTGINTHMKFLMMQYAFETWGAVRVQLKGDMRNQQSRTAIERLGATFEGTLRKNRRCWDGFTRDTFFYSILADEWPSVRERLQGLIDKNKNGTPTDAPS